MILAVGLLAGFFTVPLRRLRGRGPRTCRRGRPRGAVGYSVRLGKRVFLRVELVEERAQLRRLNPKSFKLMVYPLEFNFE